MENVKIPWPGWRAVKLLGKGGFGSVYEIERNVLGKTEKAAMKIMNVPPEPAMIRQDYSDGYTKEQIIQKYTWYVKELIKEYQLMISMKGHSNIVSCEDYALLEHQGEIGWDIYIRMELLTPLEQVLKQGELSENEVIRLGKDICKALLLCQKKKIVHRDIKPANILRSAFGDYKLGDFGIARTMEHTTAASKAGTELYMAPEVIKKQKYNQRVDIYSLGLVLYVLLNKQKIPFVPLNRPMTAAEYQQAQSRRMAGESFPDPAGGSTGLKTIIRKACAYRPEDRYASAEEMFQALERLSVPETSAPGQQKTDGRQEPQKQQEPQKHPKFPKQPDRVQENQPHFRAGQIRERYRYTEIPQESSRRAVLGIHFGAKEINCMAYSSKIGLRNVGALPNIVAFTPVGEILTGFRAQQYVSACRGEQYSIYDLYKMGNWKQDARVKTMGHAYALKDILHQILQETRELIDRKGYEDCHFCTVSVSSISYCFRQLLREVMSEHGFYVDRVQTSAESCLNYHRWKENEQYAVFAVEDETIQLALADGTDEELLDYELSIQISQMDRGESIYDACKNCIKEKYPEYYPDLYPQGKYSDFNDRRLGPYLTYLYGDEDSVSCYKEGETRAGRLGLVAAGGAALAGRRRGLGETFLLLEMIPYSVFLEIISGQGKVLMPKTLMIGEQTTLPHRSKKIAEYTPSGDGHDRLIVSFTGGGKKSLNEFLWVDMDSVYRSFPQLPSKLQVILDVDALGRFFVYLDEKLSDKNSLCNKHAYQLTKQYPVRMRTVSDGPVGQEAFTGVFEILKNNHQEIQNLAEDEKNTSFGKGLAAIDKQGELFLQKYGMGYTTSVPEVRARENETYRARNQIARDILSVLDSYEYGLRSASLNMWREKTYGLMMNHYLELLDALAANYGIRPVLAEGCRFDPNCHHAIAAEQKKGIESDCVIKELQRGYFFGGQLLRASRVTVSK